MDITVTHHELEQLHARLLRFASPHDPGLNRVLVHAGGDGWVTWTATDSYRLARLAAGTVAGAGNDHRAGGSDEIEFAVPGRTLCLAWQMCDRRETEAATFSVHDGQGVLRLPGIELPFDAGVAGYPEVDAYLSGGAGNDETLVTVSAEDLFALIHGASLTPAWLADDAQQSFVLHVDATRGTLRGVATWDGHPETTAVVACTATASVRVGVNPGFLFGLAEAAGEEFLTLHLTEDPSVPLRVETDDGFAALLMPCRIGVESSRPAFEAMLAELLDTEPDHLDRDEQGAYPVPLDEDHALSLTLDDGDPETGTPDTVRVISVLVSGIDPTPELLAELNDLNRNVRFARLFWSDGLVLAGAELLLDTLDAAELGHACRTVAALAAKVAPMLRMVHG
ncbi:MAG: T3SS (YopN, CesT) and YbjN peptide-binding chaperone 1 [Acidimicrobiia bacterium]